MLKISKQISKFAFCYLFNTRYLFTKQLPSIETDLSAGLLGLGSTVEYLVAFKQMTDSWNCALTIEFVVWKFSDLNKKLHFVLNILLSIACLTFVEYLLPV